MARRPRLSGVTCEALDDLKEKYEYKNDEQAIRRLLRKEGYDV